MSDSDELLLAGDIGGTHARFRLVSRADLITPICQATFSDCSVDVALRNMICKIGNDRSRLRSVGIGIAGRVVDGDVHITNRPGETITNESIAAALRMPPGDVVVANDMVAHLAGTPFCKVDSLREGVSVGNVEGIVMPGTGLGVGAQIFIDGTPHPLPSEGGHLTFGSPRHDFEPIRASLNRQVKGDHVSWEEAVSGPALPRLLRALDPATDATPTQVTEFYKAGHRGCTQAVRAFLLLVGARLGNLCLDLLATRRLLIGGSILNDLFDHDAEFVTKHVLQGLSMIGPEVLRPTISQTPVQLLRSSDSGLIGAATLALRAG